MHNFLRYILTYEQFLNNSMLQSYEKLRNWKRAFVFLSKFEAFFRPCNHTENKKMTQIEKKKSKKSAQQPTILFFKIKNKEFGSAPFHSPHFNFFLFIVFNVFFWLKVRYYDLNYKVKFVHNFNFARHANFLNYDEIFNNLTIRLRVDEFRLEYRSRFFFSRTVLK